MDWSAAVGLGGLAIGAFSLWLSFKSRSSAHREYFYQKQLDAFLALMRAINPLHNACQSFIVSKGCRLSDDTRREFRISLSRGEMSNPYNTFHRVHQEWALLLPGFVQDEIANFIKVLNAISAPDQIAHQYPPELVKSSDPGMVLAKAYSRIVAAVRRGLGVEPLSEEILRLIGDRKAETETANPLPRSDDRMEAT